MCVVVISIDRASRLSNENASSLSAVENTKCVCVEVLLELSWVCSLLSRITANLTNAIDDVFRMWEEQW